ncbi:probable ATP-dependent RNA helicase DDX10 isoform X2 [Dreissena polymorpha]|uniref:probable ATP-dependent RNA helicase DDX10 isoform X2 n=1 Tax=Dreissena polymorpha TaxID=45954 RepID=UPI002263C8CC|nr:probable ATP-dependent RNA helicase DDX10 isoform X2 [Dreissena polymorpha]
MNFKLKKRDQFKGRKGKILRKQLYGSKKSNHEVIDEEIKKLDQAKSEFDSSKANLFTDFPLSQKTLKGLASGKFEKPTDIQREAIHLALNGNDILGAAKTGSGKTLAFLVPVLECLFREKWSQNDGLGALIISPTRELAFQTFEVLKKIGKFHDFSAGLVIGGKPLKEEAGRINRTNIVVCTPGRLLQHMDETSYFTADSLKLLVLDEADRILDLGFAQTMNAIIENLPSERQTLLFSATQTRSVKDLARLSLHDPVFVSVHENASQSTPVQLEQNYVVCELNEKMNMLWSFLKNHLKSKTLVFLTSCKQVRYVFEAMKRLQPGIPIMALHGGMSQLKRVEAYNHFLNKQRVCLFATDIAARGLVNWVLQLDCPEDANTYIHRAGRTARYERDGQSLLVLLPSEEEGMVKQLADKKIPIEKIRINSKKLYSIQSKLESNCAAEPELKEMAQRAFMSYLKSVFLMGNKKVFDVHSIDLEQFARSLGLALAPKVRFLKKDQKRKEEIISKQSVPEVNTPKKASKSSTQKTSEPVESSDEGESGSSDEEVNMRSSVKNRKEVHKHHNEEDSESDDNSEESDFSETETPKTINVKNAKLKAKTVTKIAEKRSKTNLVKESDSDSDESDNDGSENYSESEDDDNDDDDEEDSSSESETEAKKGGGSGTFRFDIDAKDDDLFKVKRNVDIDKVLETVPGDPNEGPTSKKSKKKLKGVDKEKLAKKLIRKKILVNSKIVFNEEGQPELDPHKVPQVDMETSNAGGINIDLARQRMQQEDKIDKQIFRQKIKQKHREERLKRKEENRARSGRVENDEEMEVRLPSDGDDDDVDPLSFLPDPDEDHGKRNSDESSLEDEEWEGPASKKRKLQLKSSGKKNTVQRSSDDDEDDEDVESYEEEEGDDDDDEEEECKDVMDTELSLRDDEAIALKLLQGR